MATLTPEQAVEQARAAAEAARRSAEAAQTYRAAGATVLHTSESGAVRFGITQSGLTVEHWSGRRWISVPGPVRP